MTFKLNTHTKLKFSSIFPIKSLGARYSVRIECVHRKKSYPIYNDDFADGLTIACSIFNDLIYTKLPIDFLKGQDIGYAFNKFGADLDKKF